MSTEQALQKMVDVMNEDQRLSRLSNEELVREYFKTPREADGLIAEEMARRLWPDWVTAEDL